MDRIFIVTLKIFFPSILFSIKIYAIITRACLQCSLEIHQVFIYSPYLMKMQTINGVKNKKHGFNRVSYRAGLLIFAQR
jgi:hypothetical protein